MKAIVLKSCDLRWMNSNSNEDLEKLHKKMTLKKDEFKRLNKICPRCRHALQIYEEKCSVCEIHNISKPVFNRE